MEGSKRAALGLAICVFALVTSSAAAQSLTSQDAATYAAAFQAAQAGDWAGARATAAQAGDPVLVPVIIGRDLERRDGGHSFAVIADFIRQHPVWPTTDSLRRRAERAIAGGTSAGDLVAWFERYPPLTASGVIAYAGALSDQGRGQEAAALVRGRWSDMELSQRQQETLLSRFGNAFTAADHIARLDSVLWAGRDDEARRMFALVDAGHRALADARIRLANRSSGVDTAVAAVPASLQNDEGLIYERLRWRRRADLTARAIELLPSQPAASAHARAWWTERHILARRLFEARDYAGAYNIASAHGQTEGFPRSQAEWFSGWLALRFLGRPEAAFGHFQQLYNNVATPISLARGAYWSGRAREAAGDAAGANQWYQTAARYNTAFYGQLAAGRLGIPTFTAFPPEPAVSTQTAAAFAAEEPVQIARALAQIDEGTWADRFLLTLADETEDPQRLTLIGGLALELGRYWAAVRTGKKAARLGITLASASYPLISLSSADTRLEQAMALAIIRQESEFRQGAVSPAGARGLMQLMPQTAQAVAGQLGLAHSTGMLTSNPGHNIRLGSTYLADTIARFGGSYVLASAGYNAGPGRVNRWLGELGDPRSRDLDGFIDWMESIPIYETRNYAQRVMEALQVYRHRLGEPPAVGVLERDLNR